MKIEIIDNVLPQEQADWVEGIFTEKDPSGNSMGWQYLNGSSGKETERKFPSFVKPIYSIPMNYGDTMLMTQLACPIQTICKKGNQKPLSLYRIRAGMHIPDSTWDSHHGPHVDDSDLHHVILYYVNDSDGDTFFFKNGIENKVYKTVTPKKNRIVVFDGKILHASSYPITSPIRMTLNFNFRYG